MKSPIGVFDSGLGGLTVVRELRRLIPEADMVYFGDTARVPYGNKSAKTVAKFSRQNCRLLLSRGVRSIVVACNTSSALALSRLKGLFRVPLYGVIRPGARRAVEATGTGRIGVIGTHATIRSGAYEREIARIDGAMEVHSVACPLFVPLAEEGWVDKRSTMEIARDYLAPLKKRKVDVLILGCTHYPVLAKTIGRVMGDGVELVDSGSSCAAEIARGGRASSGLAGRGRLEILLSDVPPRIGEIGRLFMGEDIGRVEVFDPADYAGARGKTGEYPSRRR